LHRRKSDRVVAGVAGGLADVLGVGDAYVRAAFVSLSTIWGLGLVLYLVMWLITFEKVEDRDAEPVSGQQAFGLGIFFVGLMFLFNTFGWWPSGGFVMVITAIAFGVAVLTDRSVPGPLAALVDPTVERPGRVRTILGVMLLVGGLAFLANAIGPVSQLGPVLLAVGLTGVGLFVAFGPWVRRLTQDLGEERRERVRQEERAGMATHLHDSVLQTLALIQRSDDPNRMSLLARQQETELRDWLYGKAPLNGVDLMSTALRELASRVEHDHQVPVDVVTVGDALVDERSRAVLAAASEALVNAAKHSGANRLSVFMEVEDEELKVFVTDQGKGFNIDEIPEDRKGIKHSIVERTEKVGGTVDIESEPGEGTEVGISLPLVSS
ncbi:MAG TPA: PspC domain-containing protein, partial [Acidimicrobiia bacterium]